MIGANGAVGAFLIFFLIFYYSNQKYASNDTLIIKIRSLVQKIINFDIFGALLKTR